MVLLTRPDFDWLSAAGRELILTPWTPDFLCLRFSCRGPEVSKSCSGAAVQEPVRRQVILRAV